MNRFLFRVSFKYHLTIKTSYKMRLDTKIYIVKEFDRQRKLVHRNKRVIEDFKIIENLSFSLKLQKSKINEILESEKKEPAPE